jgi:hypothetical protein
MDNKKNYNSDWFAGLKHAEELGLDKHNRPVAKDLMLRNEYADSPTGFQNGVIDYVKYTIGRICNDKVHTNENNTKSK